MLRNSLVALTIAASAAGLASCGEPAPRPPAKAVETTPPPAEPTPRAPDPASQRLDRAGLIAAVQQAASDYAVGSRSPNADPIAGRSFALTVAFGCEGGVTPSGPSPEGLAGVSWGPDRKELRLGLTPGNWTESALIAGAAQGRWEAVEGFWIDRPWIKTDGCPGQTADPVASGAGVATPQTVGLAAVFETGGSRLGRRDGRAYLHVIRPSGDATVSIPDDGFRVRLEGRFVAFPDGRAIRCRSASPAQRPICIAAAQLDRVAFTTASGEVLTEWRPA
jgi:hypothetical protein